MTNLSRESEKRLLNALEKTATLIAQGDHPNEAIVKIAEEEKIPSGHIHLMVNAVNTGRTNSHRQLSNDPSEKAAEFPLADAATVLERLYPATTRTKSAMYFESVVAAEYKSPPRFLNERQRMVKATQKVAALQPVTTRPEPAKDPDTLVKRAWGQVRRLDIDVEEKRRQVAEIREASIKLAAELRRYFKQPGHIPYVEVAENAVLLFGKQASAVLSVVTPTKSATKSPIKSATVESDEAPYSLIRQAIKLAQSFKTSQEAYTAAVKTAQNESAALLSPFAPGPEVGHSVLANLSSPLTLHKVAGPIKALGSMISSGFGLMPAGDAAKAIGKKVIGAPTDDDKKELSSLMDPAHEMEIRNIQSEALLNDLMANDEVVRGHNPDDVVDAYNEISQIAPYASNKKAIIRDLLRKRLSGGGAALDQFAIGDALNSQGKLREQHQMPDTSLTTLKDIGVLPGVSQTHSKSVVGK